MVQTCVVTLEPVTAVIDVALERLCGLDVMERIESGFNEAFLDLTDDLPAETLIDDVVDIGAAAADQLGLELDLYPRKPGAVFEGLSGEGPKEPLGRLRNWRTGESAKTRRGDGCSRPGFFITRRAGTIDVLQLPCADVQNNGRELFHRSDVSLLHLRSRRGGRISQLHG